LGLGREPFFLKQPGSWDAWHFAVPDACRNAPNVPDCASLTLTVPFLSNG
jgi:hypothetical protein